MNGDQLEALERHMYNLNCYTASEQLFDKLSAIFDSHKCVKFHGLIIQLLLLQKQNTLNINTFPWIFN